MKIVVTSGATREFIDRVRFISNTSTGRLGSLIASSAADNGFSVVYVHGAGAALPPVHERITSRSIVSAQDLTAVFRGLLVDKDIKAVVHPMAVSDFTPAEQKPDKIPSGTEKLELTLVPAPRAVNLIREMRPDIVLVSFKLETGIGHEELISRAQQSLERTGSSAVVANLLEHTGPDSHTAFLVCSDGTVTRSEGKEHIAADIISFLRSRL